jgi:anti-sigma-K factor RskA
MSLDPTDPCAELQPQIAAYALGETEAAAELLEHLAECPACQRDLRAYVQVARMLPYDAPNVAPPPDLRARILSAVEESAAGIPAASPPVSPPESRLALVALVALLGWNITLQRQLRTQAAQIAASRANWQTMIVLLNDPAVRWYAVAGDTANGHFWATPQGKVACLVAQRLPAVRNDQVYQVWLVHGGEHTSGGVFEAREGNGWILIRSTEPLANYDFVGVTIEPRGGSAAPTSRPILQGEIAAAHTPTVADRQLLLSLIAPPGD